MATNEGSDGQATQAVDSGRAELGAARPWRRRVVIGVVGVVFYAALVFGLSMDGGTEGGVFFGTVGFLFSFPILLLLGKGLATVVNKIRALGNRARLVITVAPTLLLAGLTAFDGYRAQNPVRKFERWIARPAPVSLRDLSAYTYKGMNSWTWAFHFGIDTDDLPKILSRRTYRHEVDPAGFDLAQVRESGSWRPGYPIPPPDFKAVHCYRFHAPTARAGYDVTLYGDSSQTEFFAYGSVE